MKNIPNNQERKIWKGTDCIFKEKNINKQEEWREKNKYFWDIFVTFTKNKEHCAENTAMNNDDNYIIISNLFLYIFCKRWPTNRSCAIIFLLYFLNNFWPTINKMHFYSCKMLCVVISSFESHSLIYWKFPCPWSQALALCSWVPHYLSYPLRG